MIKNNLSSETAFELLLKNTNNIIKRKLSRIDFHKAINNDSELGTKFSAPEIDALFNLLDANKDGELDIDKWR
jgi:Ca2+-binding EF-hand superfamily protein